MKVPRPLLLLILASISTGASATTYNVTTAADFQAALAEAQSNFDDDTINVADGTYDIEASGTLTYTAAATEAYSLSILGNDSTFVILDGATVGTGVPILRIDTTAVTNGETVGITVTNMTFQDGNAAGTAEDADGGALFINMGTSVIVQVSGSEFYGNAANDDGGAIFIRGNVLEGIYLVDLTIDGNIARGIDNSNGDGGGAYVAGGFSTVVEVSDIFFWDNEADDRGGGISIEGLLSGDPCGNTSFYDIDFDGNVINDSGGGGGGAAVLATDAWIDTTGFFDNIATDIGGGLHLRGNTRLYMKNSGFLGNSAFTGGGLGTDTAFDSGIVLEHTTIAGNTAQVEGGGIYMSRGGSLLEVSFYNNIMWGNNGQSGADLYIDDDPAGLGGLDVATVQLFNNIYADFTTGCTIDTGCTPDIQQSDNINANPNLDPTGHLMSNSPAIDAGLNGGHPSYPAIIVDGDLDVRPFNSIVDIGADEYTGDVPQGADLRIAKSDSPDPVTGGQDLTYTVTVTNDGPDDATGVTIIDTLPISISVAFVSATPSQGTCTEISDQVTCAFGDVANGATATATIVITTPEVGIDTFISNSASVTGNENDANPSNNSITEATTVVPIQPDQADLAITKTATPDPVFSGGQQLTYSITVTNNGPDGATGIVMTDTLPAGVDASQVTVTPPANGSCTTAFPFVTCNIAPLALDESASTTIVVLPSVVMSADSIDNMAEVTGTEVDPNTENNTVTVSTTVNPPEADMMISVSSSSSEPSIDEQITITITVTNDGPSDNTNVVIELTLPGEGVAQSLTPSQGTCDGMEGTVTCTLGDMDDGDQVTITYVVTVPSYAVEMLLSALVSGDTADPTTANDTGAVTVSVIEAVEIIIRGVGGSGSFGVVTLLAMLLAVLLSVAPARAESPWYFGASIGESNANYSAADLTSDLDSLGWTITDVSTNDSDTFWKVYGGYMINEYVALELGYVELGEVTTQYTANIPPSEFDSLLSDTYSVHPYLGNGWTAAGVLTWPFSEKWAAFARAGVLGWEADIDVRIVSGGTGSVTGDDSGRDVFYGLGLEWKTSESFAITAEWERYRLNDWVDAPSIGFRWYFQ